MAKKEYCNWCHQPIMIHQHRFSRSLGNILWMAFKDFGIGKPFHLQQDLALTKNQYANFQKLQYWDLAKKSYENGKRRGGYWELTFKALEFIRGKIRVPEWVQTFNNQVREAARKEVSLQDALGYYDLPKEWAERAEPIVEYAADKQGQLSFV